MTVLLEHERKTAIYKINFFDKPPEKTDMSFTFQ